MLHNKVQNSNFWDQNVTKIIVRYHIIENVFDVWDGNVEERRDPAVCSVGECCASVQCQRSPQLGNISLLQIQNTKLEI